MLQTDVDEESIPELTGGRHPVNIEQRSVEAYGGDGGSSPADRTGEDA